ncbi:MAG TPA: pectin acetylesterase-family hydrolase, partial [Thermoanaerobaculia bacterium]
MRKLVLLLLLTGCASAPRLHEGWNRIEGGPGTGCSAPASDFAFFARPGDPKKLVVYLDGGGACWNEQTCTTEPEYDPAVDDSDDPSKRFRRGIFALDDPRNPIRGFTIVSIPYCTGDVYMGTRTVTYAGKEIRHMGAANAARALEWTFAAVRDPEVVFVYGLSAGAIPSPLFAAQIAKRFPRARVVQLGEGAGAYRSAEVPRVMTQWGAASKTFEQLYIDAHATSPRVTFAQFNNANDAVQSGFLYLLGTPAESLPPLLLQNHADIRAAVPQFRSYTTAGDEHVLLPR